VVDEDGYTEEDEDFDGLPTIKLNANMPNAIVSGVQFAIQSSPKEQALQGEGRADYDGNSFLDSAKWRFNINYKHVLSNIADGFGNVGKSNQIILRGTLDEEFHDDPTKPIHISEIGIVNSLSVPANPATSSGSILAKVAFNERVSKEQFDRIHFNWVLTIGPER
jgi:hypothetical protein